MLKFDSAFQFKLYAEAMFEAQPHSTTIEKFTTEVEVQGTRYDIQWVDGDTVQVTYLEGQNTSSYGGRDTSAERCAEQQRTALDISQLLGALMAKALTAEAQAAAAATGRAIVTAPAAAADTSLPSLFTILPSAPSTSDSPTSTSPTTTSAPQDRRPRTDSTE